MDPSEDTRLTEEDLALLNTLAYIGESEFMLNQEYKDIWSGEYENKDMTFGEVLGTIKDDTIAALRGQGDETDDNHISGNEWADAIEYAKSNSRIANLRYADVDSDATDGSRAFCLTSATDTYIVFKGTGSDGEGSEWPDNLEGLHRPDTAAQRAALNYTAYIKARFGGEITLTGHSKGANKAMYAAVLAFQQPPRAESGLSVLRRVGGPPHQGHDRARHEARRGDRVHL